MPELNPYEAPQSKQLASAVEPPPDEPWPLWLGRALWAQIAAIVVTLCAAPITVVPEQQIVWNTFLLCAFGIVVLLSLLILLAAIRYRIGWLVMLELIVIGLPLVALFNVQSR